MTQIVRNERFEFVPIDLATGDVAELLDGVKTVYHLAAEPGVRASWGERFARYSSNNVLATQRLLEGIASRGSARLVYASSSSVYGDAETLPTSETAACGPVSPYGLTKLTGEELCDVYRRSFGVESVALRYFTVFGPRQRPDMAFHIFLRAALTGQPIRVFGDGHQARDFTYVADVVAATRAAGEAAGSLRTTYNVGGGLRATVREALDIIASLVPGKQLDVRYEERQSGDVRNTGADTRAARTDLGFSPMTSSSKG